MFKKAQEKTDAVSPVIGVILLVAVTVALVALTTVIVFDIGSDVSDTADATIQLDGATNTSSEAGEAGVQATIIRNENVAQFNLSSPNNNNSLEIGNSQVGDSFTLYDGTGTYSVIAELDDGSTQVLTSTDR